MRYQPSIRRPTSSIVSTPPDPLEPSGPDRSSLERSGPDLPVLELPPADLPSQEALERCQRILIDGSKHLPADALALVWLHAGHCLLDLHRPGQALEAFQEAGQLAAGLDPVCGEHLELERELGLGWGHVLRMTPDEGVRHFVRALLLLERPELHTPLRDACVLVGYGRATASHLRDYRRTGAFRKVIDRYFDHEDPALFPFVAQALAGLGESYDEVFECAPAALEPLRQLERRFGDTTDPAVLRAVELGRLLRASVLETLDFHARDTLHVGKGRYVRNPLYSEHDAEESLALYERLAGLYFDSPDLELRRIAVTALRDVPASERSEQMTRLGMQLLERYGADPDPVIAARVEDVSRDRWIELVDDEALTGWSGAVREVFGRLVARAIDPDRPDTPRKVARTHLEEALSTLVARAREWEAEEPGAGRSLLEAVWRDLAPREERLGRLPRVAAWMAVVACAAAERATAERLVKTAIERDPSQVREVWKETGKTPWEEEFNTFARPYMPRLPTSGAFAFIEF